MYNLAKELLKDLEKLSFDNMDNFDKYDYFTEKLEAKTKLLCHKVIQEENPSLIETKCNKDISKLTEEIKQIHHLENTGDCMSDTLCKVGINNVTLEQAFETYCSLMNEIEGDEFVQQYNGNPDNCRYIIQ